MKKEPRTYTCEPCNKVFMNIEDYSNHRINSCKKTTDKNRDVVRKGLKQIGALDNDRNE